MPEATRRAVGRRTLLLGVSGLAGALASGCASPMDRRPSPGPAAPGPPSAAPGPPSVTSRRVHSAARGTDVQLITVVPSGVPAGRLPVCLALHGRYSDAAGLVALGLPDLLHAAVRAGAPPFALVAVDGGDSYWVARTPGDDPMRMLRTELPGWLVAAGLGADGGVPRTVLGISMGCFGALVYARARAAQAPPTTGTADTAAPVSGTPGEGRLAGVATLSPALFRSWPAARSVHAFAGQDAWAAAEPLRHPVPALRLGVWCGRQDPFYPSARQLVAQQHPALVRLGTGGHTPGYWRRVLPDALRFLATS
jgi:S-formylglutathione hydrolase FrmB